ncbi:WD repeat-containing protein 62 isoform X1 [Lingula anatina]|uniref:WD repeat-containing protein 62 isoform X1 n=1 Tax=Lingula anatina TaxID=7574 RepID=A0A1S3IB05_LINAN|nr:WD repeat-containing protein 62 isoform X1 [Lingula anatina]|eukprot:XP_013394584.1 WD repeat-containing protein 62 isoform X1 [Lingula anatina]
METTPVKVLRTGSLKRKSKVVDISRRVTLERVLGLTVTTNAALAVDSKTGLIAYPAGCVVVLFNARKHKQSHIFNTCKKTITCLAFAGDGKHLATGESGHQPHVRVWDIEEKVQVAEFHGHKFGLQSVVFSPNLKYLVSVGTQHDMIINVWNWRTNTKVASNKVSSKVNAVGFSEDGSMFVTVGNRHVKFWYLDASKSKIKNETLPLLGRSAIIGDQKNNFFCGVAMGCGAMAGSVYAITQSGRLCEFNAKRLLDKWVELRTTKANCLSAGADYIFVGCADGTVRIFSAQSLHFVCSMPKPHYLGVDVTAGQDPSHMGVKPDNARYPDCIALEYDEMNKKVTCIYSDHSLYMWDVRDIRKIGKAWSALFHSSCIWGLEVYPVCNNPALPPGSFMTCSSDDTIRVWNIDPHMTNDTLYKRNIYSHELLKVLYVDKNLSFLCDKEYNPTGGADKTDTTYDGKNGVRAVRVSPDGQHLASGDRTGNIRVHNLQNLKELCIIEAHDGEVLCLEYSTLPAGPRLLASASRDRLIHVFDTRDQYNLVQTLDDHSSSITAVKFAENDGQIKMLSCAADKSVLFRTATQGPDHELQFVLDHHLVGKTTLYDMDVDPCNKFAITACQDRNVRIYNIKTGKNKKCYKGATGDDGTLIKVQLDPSGTYACTSSSDKSLAIFDFYTGECMGSMFGHSEIATGVRFMNDLKHIITVSGDGCIFIWKVSSDLTQQMYQRLIDLGQLTTKYIPNGDNRSPASPRVEIENIPERDEGDFGPPPPEFLHPNVNSKTNGNGVDYRFSVGQLPAWAKKQMSAEPVTSETGSQLPSQPKGKWATRVEPQGIAVKSILDNNNAIEVNWAENRRFTFEADQSSNIRRETIVLPKATRPNSIPIIEDDDNNQDDDDDDFFPMSAREQAERLDRDASGLLQGGRVTERGRSYPSIDTLASTPSEEDEDTETEEHGEVIYYPQDGEDNAASESSSFQVVAISKEELKASRRQMKMQKNKESEPAASISDSFSDTHSHRGEPNSEDEMGDDEMDLSSPQSSFPNTPVTPGARMLFDQLEREKFSRTFEDMEATLAGGGEHSLDGMDQLNGGQLMHPRLSISARFLSRAQQEQLRNVIGMQPERDTNVVCMDIEKKKESMVKSADDPRRRLQELGWTGLIYVPPDPNEQPERERTNTSYRTKTQQSPPSRLAKESPHNSDTPDGGKRTKKRSMLNLVKATAQAEQGVESPASEPEKEPVTQPIKQPDKERSSMRRAWSSTDVSRQPLEIAGMGGRQQRNLPPTPDTQTQSLRAYGKNSKLRPSAISRAQSRAVWKQLILTALKTREQDKPSRDKGNIAKLEKSLGKIPSPASPTKEFPGSRFSDSVPSRSRSEANLLASGRDLQPVNTTPKRMTRRQHSYRDATASSSAKMSRASSSQGLNAGKVEGEADGDASNLSKAMSMHTLSNVPSGTVPGAGGVQKRTYSRRRSDRLSRTRSMDLTSSSPNLLSQISVEEHKSPASSESDHTKTESQQQSTSRVSNKGSRAPKQSSDKSESTLTKDTLKGSRDSLASISSLPDDDKSEKVSVHSGNVLSKDEVDRLAMPPPPAAVAVSKSKPTDTFLKRAAQSKRRSNADLSLNQAKDILLGKSGILSKTTSMDTGLNMAGKVMQNTGEIDIDSKSSEDEKHGNSKRDVSSKKDISSVFNGEDKTDTIRAAKGDIILQAKTSGLAPTNSEDVVPKRRTRTPRRQRPKSEIFSRSNFSTTVERPASALGNREGGEPIPAQENKENIEATSGSEGVKSLLKKFSKSREGLDKLTFETSPGTPRSRRSSISKSREDLRLSLSSNQLSYSSPSLNSGKLSVKQDDENKTSDTDSSVAEITRASPRTMQTDHLASPRGRQDSVRSKGSGDLDSSSDSLPSYSMKRRLPSGFSPARSSSPKVDDQGGARPRASRVTSPLVMTETEKDPLVVCAEAVTDLKKSIQRVTDMYQKVSRRSSDETSRKMREMLSEAFKEIQASLSSSLSSPQQTPRRESPRTTTRGQLGSPQTVPHNGQNVSPSPPPPAQPIQQQQTTTVPSKQQNLASSQRNFTPTEQKQGGMPSPFGENGMDEATYKMLFNSFMQHMQQNMPAMNTRGQQGPGGSG